MSQIFKSKVVQLEKSHSEMHNLLFFLSVTHIRNAGIAQYMLFPVSVTPSVCPSYATWETIRDTTVVGMER